MIRRDRLHELQLRVAEIKMRQPHRRAVHVLAVKHLEAERVAPEFQRGFRVRHSDGEMIEPLMFHKLFTSTGARFAADS